MVKFNRAMRPRNCAARGVRSNLHYDRFLDCTHVHKLDCGSKTTALISLDGEIRIMHDEHVVVALGAITRTFPTPGLGAC
ncbi:hypothetical protein [Cryobacterium sp. Y11]|uniref:hypothetical protein n=1 Tax=Cryobacterium sp. Y11 TaxID=2045016 RepID=UPI000CE4DD0A|nr:hypothetical protein [Cryobacterium sp. Y11]